MNYAYLLPFAYFFDTRLRGNSIAFHLVFEWLAAALLVTLLGTMPPAQSLKAAGLSYLAFISLYEIGYLINDLVVAPRETNGRLRGPTNSTRTWMLCWIAARLLAFILSTHLMGKIQSIEWWSYFSALCIVIAMHNLAHDREHKTVTFLWLSLLRFMAPIVFVVKGSQLMGIGLAAAMSYVAFRFLGYLDSKNLLQMPDRKAPSLRMYFFTAPLVGTIAFWPYSWAHGFLALTAYYAFVAFLGTFFASAVSRD